MKKQSSRSSGLVKIYEMVFNRLKAQVEREGLLPWQRPWRGSGMMPQNFISRKAYRGINPWILSMAGFECPYWVSFRQAKALGGRVRKGEKGFPVVFWKWIEKSNSKYSSGEDNQREKNIPLLRYYTVFNLVQCDGIIWNKPQAATIPVMECCEAIIRDNPRLPTIRTGYDHAFYCPTDDFVGMPNRSSFINSEMYYDTLFHELTHATGHESRLGRFQNKTGLHSFDVPTYSKEELVAEIGGAFLNAHAGIVNRTIESNAAYVKHWMEKLEDNPKWLIQAAGQAQKSTDYILGVEYS